MSIDANGIRISGALAEFAEGYWMELTQLGYAPASVRLQMKILADLSGWLLSHGRAAADVIWIVSCVIVGLPATPDMPRSGRCALSLIIFGRLRSYRDWLPTQSWARSMHFSIGSGIT